MSNSAEIPSIIERGLPHAVRYDLTSPNQVTITLPTGSGWSSELHWHETHTEYLRVIQGSIKVRLGNAEQVVTATKDNQPELQVDRYVWHEWQRAELDGEDVIVIERTDPADGEKALFFWNLNGAILNAAASVSAKLPFLKYAPARLMDLAIDFWITLNLYIIFHTLDNFPVVLNAPSLLHKQKLSDGRSLLGWSLLAVDWAVSHFVLSLASLVGRLLNLQAVRPEYTPPDRYKQWNENRAGSQTRKEL